ncbi:hypothetical protein BJY24_007678 [Nocardia transvalensis]|uniref:Uncharacterized protein n=1 Tax=Nocardia transvalensis TaxID=37333 RepID=A0A7W9UML7_9NOCA|nr:hypothetical protein [Nocardia transvalensis]MBB5918766.1 hypothetical protein [Nocardia transvalensis]
MLDMDEPDEVAATAGTFSRAITSVTSHVGTVVGDLVLPRSPASPLDRGLAAVHRDKIAQPLKSAVRKHSGRAPVPHQAATEVSTALSTADVDGGRQVRGSEPV